MPDSIDKVSKEVYPEYVTRQFVMGQFDPVTHDEMIEIEEKYANQSGRIMHNEAYNAFKQMWELAFKNGIRLQVISAARNFDYQKGIWERKWNGATILSDGTAANEIDNRLERAKKILLYSSMPGASRHHWGTDIDLNSFNNRYFSTGEGLKIYTWLKENAPNFGFCQPYTNKANGRTGYEEEKWHWTYVPISNMLTQYYTEHITNQDLVGFQGSDVTEEIDMIKNYVLGIDAKCL